MPESGRYTFEVRRNAHGHEDGTTVRPSNASTSSGEEPSAGEEAQAQFDFRGIRKFLFQEGHWSDLFGVSMCWLLLDFAFCK